MRQILNSLLTIYILLFIACSNDKLPTNGRVNVATETVFKNMTSQEFGKEDSLILKSEIFKVWIDEKKSIELTTVSVPVKAFLKNDTVIIKTGNPTKVKTTLPSYYEQFELSIYNGKYNFRQIGENFMFPYLDKYEYDYYPLTINKRNPVFGDTLMVNVTIKRTAVAKTGYDEITYYKFEINTTLH